MIQNHRGHLVYFFLMCKVYIFIFQKENDALYLETDRLNKLVTDLEVTLRKCKYKYNVVNSCDSAQRSRLRKLYFDCKRDQT